MGLTLRLTLLLAAALGLTVLLVAFAFWLERDTQDRGPRLPLPDQIAAMVELLERRGPGDRTTLLRAFNSDDLVLRLDEPAEPSAARQLREMPALSWMATRYASALGERQVHADLVRGGNGGQLRLRMQLADGTPLTVEMRGELLRQARNRGVVLLLGVALLATAGIAAWSLRRQTRPIEELARAIERFGQDPGTRLPPAQGAPEIRRLQAAFVLTSQRIAELIDSRSRLFAAISHDLGTYLTRLRLRIDLIPDADQRSRAEHDVEQMSALLRDTLDLARLQSAASGEKLPAPSAVDFVELLRDEVAQLNAAAKAAGNPSPVQLGPMTTEPVLVLGEPRLLRRMIGNLLDNAVKYGGRAEVRLERADRQLLLEIDDEGPGIPLAQREQAFEPFYRGDAARNLNRPGSGLGLAIVAETARRHASTVRLLDSPRGGLRVRVQLPVLG